MPDYNDPAEASAKRPRKRTHYYDVEGNYGCGWECVTAEERYSEARARMREYRDNQPGYAFRIRGRYAFKER